MKGNKKDIVSRPTDVDVILDLSDCFTCSFPEFTPFCSQLFYFSSFKAFKTLAQA